MTDLTIVMYHYVRDIENSKYPRIKGLEFHKFQRQLDYIQNNYSIITQSQLSAFYKDPSRCPLLGKSCWLTFDDGYADHYEYIFPELKKRRLQGSFFPPVKCILDRDVLDVNKIHFILASNADVNALVEELRLLYIENDIQRHVGKDFDELFEELAHANRMDSANTMFIKRLLQFALPERLRNTVIEQLFKKHVSSDVRSFANDLYMSRSQLEEMANEGMYVGGHGYEHMWLSKEPYARQLEEIELSLDFLKDIGAPVVDWVMCYPHGEYNSDTLNILKVKSCSVGITTKVAVANLAVDNALELPRLDTNDLPQ